LAAAVVTGSPAAEAGARSTRAPFCVWRRAGRSRQPVVRPSPKYERRVRRAAPTSCPARRLSGHDGKRVFAVFLIGWRTEGAMARAACAPCVGGTSCPR
jgi:hypothetical protein